MKGNFIMLQKEDLKEVIAEVLETMVGKNLMKEPAQPESTEYLRRAVCTPAYHLYHTLAHGEA